VPLSADFLRNEFYQPFDTEVFEGPRSVSHIRSFFAQDRDRIGHSAAYRRLQAKTQVFRSGEYDFYRTRLTHTNEVALIGRGICDYLCRTSPDLTDHFHPDADLVEACCMAHDIGHPPFGHAGERSLHRLMLNYGGFEGNAQTVRLLTRTIFSDGNIRRGMKPTRAFLDGVLKYKRLFSSFEEAPQNHFLYDDQGEVNAIVAGSGNIEGFESTRSIECQIMDWADDTAYSLGDLVDGIRARFITVDRLERWAGDNSSMSDPLRSEPLSRLLSAIRKGTLSRFIALRIGDFIQACSLTKATGPLSNATARHQFSLIKTVEIERANDLYQEIAKDLVFRTPEVQQLEYKGGQILNSLFKLFSEEYFPHKKPAKRPPNLLPKQIEVRISAIPYESVTERARVVCDHLSGMSDDFVVRTYRRLFDSDFGSIVDLV